MNRMILTLVLLGALFCPAGTSAQPAGARVPLPPDLALVPNDAFVVVHLKR